MSNETILKRLEIIGDLQDELNKLKAAHTDRTEENELTQEIQEETEKFKEIIKAKKERVKNDPQVMAFEIEMKDIRVDLKENKEILAQELADYYRESGKLDIKDENGETKRIKFSAKLVNS